MKISRGASHSLKQAQEQQDVKAMKNGKMNKNQQSMGLDAAQSAQVSLSKQAQQIKQVTDIVKKDSVDDAKVAKFQSLIETGKYKVDSAKLADKLVDEHMKMST